MIPLGLEKPTTQLHFFPPLPFLIYPRKHSNSFPATGRHLQTQLPQRNALEAHPIRTSPPRHRPLRPRLGPLRPRRNQPARRERPHDRLGLGAAVGPLERRAVPIRAHPAQGSGGRDAAGSGQGNRRVVLVCQ